MFYSIIQFPINVPKLYNHSKILVLEKNRTQARNKFKEQKFGSQNMERHQTNNNGEASFTCLPCFHPLIVSPNASATKKTMKANSN